MKRSKNTRPERVAIAAQEMLDDLWMTTLRPGDDPLASRDFYPAVRRSVTPRDFIEEIQAQEVGLLSAELIRWHERKAAYMRERAEFTYCEAERIYGKPDEALPDEGKTDEASQGALPDEPMTISEVAPSIRRFQEQARAVKKDFMMIAAMSDLGTIAEIDAVIARIESRRNALLREIDRRRLTALLIKTRTR